MKACIFWIRLFAASAAAWTTCGVANAEPWKVIESEVDTVGYYEAIIPEIRPEASFGLPRMKLSEG